MRALWSSRQNCSHNMFQKLKRIKRFSEKKKTTQIGQNVRGTNGAHSWDKRDTSVRQLHPGRFLDPLEMTVSTTQTVLQSAVYTMRLDYKVYDRVLLRTASDFTTSLDATKGGAKQIQANANKRRQTRANASKHRGENANMGEHQSIALKRVRAIDARNSRLENGSNAAKTSVRAPGLSPDEREHPFV